HRLDQRLQHFTDRYLDEAGRIVRNRVGEPVGKARGKRLHRLLDVVRDLERVGPGLQENADQHRLLAVDPADKIIVLRAQLDARDVLQAQRRAVRIGAHDDVLEFARIGEPALGRSEERRVGKGGRTRWTQYQTKQTE